MTAWMLVTQIVDGVVNIYCLSMFVSVVASGYATRFITGVDIFRKIPEKKKSNCYLLNQERERCFFFCVMDSTSFEVLIIR